MSEDVSPWAWATKIPFALMLAVLSAVIFFAQLDSDRRHLAAQVMKMEAKQTAHVEEITKLTEQMKGIDRRLERMEQTQDKILGLLMNSKKPLP
ncbi:MAG: hypothetical protein JRI95_13995 [Deltaproteobacteria bacterium]|nr:hypothetical protein [Deltaproteobacteria bacterium]MBW2084728.1 hypothetical protein [Deltaproteobacteria bacterium]